MNVQLVQYGVRILDIDMRRVHKDYSGCEGANLAQTRCEYDYLVDFAHSSQKVVYAWAFDYVDIVPVVLDLDRHDVISLLNRLERKVLTLASIGV
jgi:hypothetical protein